MVKNTHYHSHAMGWCGNRFHIIVAYIVYFGHDAVCYIYMYSYIISYIVD